jgi:two-component system OmpR family sensor kinase
VSKGKLTRQELGWLLTQEAQGAAERLRKGVTALTQAPPRPGVAAEVHTSLDTSGVDATLSALDDAMKMLANLHPNPISVRGRRGRIDLASLLWEVAPEARVSIEPGSGTEVFGDEAELRRMLHVMLGHGSGTGSAVTIKRDHDEVVLGVVLGPESSASAEAERAWLSRMAIRYGGRHELEGSMEVMALPADGVEVRDDVAKLRKELDEARKQGQAYARELAAMWSAGEEAVTQSTAPPLPSAAAERHGAVARLAGGVAATLRAMLSPVGRELGDIRAAAAAASSASARKSAPDGELNARVDIDERLEAIRHRLLSVQDFVGELAAIGESDPQEPPRDVDLAEVVRLEVRALDARATRSGVTVTVRGGSEDAAARLHARVAPRAAAVIVRALVGHAIVASPRGSNVVVTLVPSPVSSGDGHDGGQGPRIVVDDSGTILPAVARKALLALEVEPGTFGRPSGVALFAAAEIAAAQGCRVEVSDAAGGDGGDESKRSEAGPGGLRVSVSFPP